MEPLPDGSQRRAHLRVVQQVAARRARQAQLESIRSGAQDAGRGDWALRGVGGVLDDWSAAVDAIVAESTAAAAPKRCIARPCIQGLEAALERAARSAQVKEVPMPQTSAQGISLLASTPKQPLILRDAAASWGPLLKWDAAYLSAPANEAGDDECEQWVRVGDAEGNMRTGRFVLIGVIDTNGNFLAVDRLLLNGAKLLLAWPGASINRQGMPLLPPRAPQRKCT